MNTAKLIFDQMQRFAKEDHREKQESVTLNAGAVGVFNAQRVKGNSDVWDATLESFPKVLLDGGASHNVNYRAKIPEDSVKRQEEFAHCMREGYVKGSDIIFLDESLPDDKEDVPSIISLGRLIQKGK